jgi:hypothetical protein
MEKTTGLLYTFPRRLFWRRWQPKSSKLSQYFFFDLVRKLSNIILYNNLHDGRYLLLISSTWYFCFTFSMTRTQLQP